MNDWVDAEQHAERARAFFQSGQWDKALAELQQAVALNPQQTEWHFGMGLTLDALKRYDEALACYEQVLKLRGNDPDVLTHIGDDLIRLGRYETAIESLQRANAIDPDHEPGYCSRIIAYGKLGDHEQAEAMFYLARQVKDTCPRCFENLGHSLMARGQSDRAIWCWQQTLKHSPFSPRRIAAGVSLNGPISISSSRSPTIRRTSPRASAWRSFKSNWSGRKTRCGRCGGRWRSTPPTPRLTT